MSTLHRAWAEIDLDALVHNFKVIKESTDAKIISVVKANAYGHSVDAVAPLLENAGSDAFAVSNIDEAKQLREIGIKKPVLILGYTPPFLASELAKEEITQAVYSLEYAQKLSACAARAGVTVDAHLKIDTGMGRIGFDCRKENLAGIAEAVDALSLPGIRYTGAFMHFAAADRGGDEDGSFTTAQYERFCETLRRLEARGFTFEVKHCCNSAGILLEKEKQMDAVRPGIILYGLTPSDDLTPGLDLIPVMSFKAAVSMVKTVHENESVNYGRTYVANKPTKIATITAGYADGFPRLLSSRGYVLIHGKKSPIVGRICMDQFCADVTDIDGVQEGDTVTLFGRDLPVEDVARFAQTINYEIVCGLSKRVPRVLIKDGKEIEE